MEIKRPVEEVEYDYMNLDRNERRTLRDALGGSADSQYEFGFICAIFSTEEKNQKHAVKWYRLAAKQGHLDAMCQLGMHYFYGDGVHGDKKAAMRWFEKAAYDFIDGSQCAIEMLQKHGYK